MKRKNIQILLTIALILAIGACRDIYDPNISSNQSVLVVEGLISTNPEPYFINLTNSAPFGSSDNPTPVTNASVHVKDHLGTTYQFTEVQAGKYQSPYEMIGIVGYKYTLHIVTADGFEYASYQQEILPSLKISSLLAEKVTRIEIIEPKFGDIIINEIKGVEATLFVEDEYPSNSKIRFSSDIMVQYNYPVNDPDNPPDPMAPAIPVWYCWNYLDKAEGINNINLPSTNNMPGDVNNNIVAFVPERENRYYYLTDDKIIINLLLRVTLYTLNQDAYQFFHDMHKQLTSDGSLFDPIASQIFSNIRCVTDPKKPVVGFFEASSTNVKGFILRTSSNNNSAFFEPTDKFDETPPINCLNNTKPPFWVD